MKTDNMESELTVDENSLSETKSLNNVFPVIPMRGIVAFPHLVVHFDVVREASVNAVKEALKRDRKIFIVAQKDVFTEEPVQTDLYKIGVVAEIRQVLKTPDNVLRVLVEGLSKAKLTELSQVSGSSAYYEAKIKPVKNSVRSKCTDTELEALVRSVKDIFERYAQYIPKMPDELAASILCQTDPELLFENIVFNINLSYVDKQDLLEQSSVFNKLSMLFAMLNREVQVLQIEHQIQEQVKESIGKSQREYFLREQMKAISEQLGDDNDFKEEINEYRKKIESMKLPEETASRLTKEADRLSKLPEASQESFVIRNYLDTVLSLPWNKETRSKINIEKAREILNKDHYGLEKVKERILESIAVHAMKPDVTGQIICLVGPPGVGKTSIGRSIAKSLGRKYQRISLGGVKDESDIRGHRKTYVGAMPGRIINAMIAAGTKNPLILFDEIDKMSNDFRGDPSSAMLEVLDGEQNNSFVDHYVEVPFDLSKVMFITTANTTQTIPAPLLDRMEVIELTSYTREEKFHIASEHLVPKQLKENGLKPSMMKVSDDGIYTLIDSYTREAGVRNLERNIASLCRKTAKEIVSEKTNKLTFTKDNISEYLGHAKYTDDEKSKKDEVGLVNGLAWTSVGGVLMPLEALVLKGKGNIEITGSLGDVMKESAKIAVSYSRNVAEKYSINPEFYKENDIHIHAPEGAVPKDGPSAGVTMVTAMISALSGIKVRGDVAMTGEITLHGNVLPIGGLREKTMAAYKEGIKTIIIPEKNKPDLEDVDKTVRENINFVFARTLDDVLKTALVM
ncbi:MAG: endopeptidase La [Oscillospiraceae bacterium]|nr:endopeptidase La [Oscillospiraceae bacterium]